MTFMLREGDESIERTGAAELVEANNRIFYSFVEAPAMRKLKTFLQIPLDNQIRAHKLWFLFKSHFGREFGYESDAGSRNFASRLLRGGD